MPPCAIVYTTDSTYLFPTLVSAMQARRQASRHAADVVICSVDLDEATRRVFAPVCEQEGVLLHTLPGAMIEGQTAMLARLFLNRFMPEEYTQYLYLDGDVHILGEGCSLDPLIEAPVPPGCFLAANDPMTFLLEDDAPQSRDLAKHLVSVGFSRAQALEYFNSGVLRIHREGWDTIGQAAWQYYRHHVGETNQPSRFPDQDALNVAAWGEALGAEETAGLGKRLPMSLAWNFPIFMRHSRVEAAIQPRITHFMSSPKPWHGAFPPWTQSSCTPYSDALTAYPQLAPFAIHMPLHKRAKYHLHQRAKKCMETITWGFSPRRGRILSYETACQVEPSLAGMAS